MTKHTNDPDSASQHQQSDEDSSQNNQNDPSLSYPSQRLAGTSTDHSASFAAVSSRNMRRSNPTGSSSQPVQEDNTNQPASDCSSLDGNVFVEGSQAGARPNTRRSQTSESITSSNFNYSMNRRFISKNQMKEFREAFRLFDKDNDGSITKEELGTVMRSLGQFARVEELEEMLLEIDVDGDGNVSFEEFVDIMSNMTDTVAEASADQEERELRDAFRVFDKHNRGYITASDLRAVLQCLGEDLDEEEIEDMIKEVDVDGDGRIDFYEFVHALGEPEDSQENDDEEEVVSLSVSCDVNA
ncbi:uncharacterized protein LOC128739726 [Sabethes cyaneus]|uniref:uncharacterized protein LOC128739726 n=1 Tax=Sabethes cyaneus TaxID=53552 RepID=UPI00237E2409|nr:uncharacterized protein LOC128739726 [Sabethes cyaneus]